MRHFARARFCHAALLASALTLSCAAYANHGPGASGGGSATMSGETLKQNHWELSLTENFTQFEHFTAEQAAARAATGGDFDALRRAYVTGLDVGYGLINDLQLNLNIGYFIGEQFISADRQEDGSIETADATPTGLTDALLTAKYRFYRGWWGQAAIVGGVKLPTGRDDVHLSNGELISPTDQPGTGAFDFPLGIAWSRFLTPRVTLDASASYLFRTRHDDFQVGDRLDVGTALAYRLTGDINTFPQFSVFGETLLVYLQKDWDQGDHDPNSGSTTVYLSPGVRVRFNPNMALTFATAFPVYQEVNGDQGKVAFKASLSLSFSF